MNKNIFFYNYPKTTIGITEEDGKISGVFFRDSEKALKNNLDPAHNETPLIKKASVQLGEYFEGKRKEFDVPLLLRGTDFQLSVWKALQKIPWGKTRSYKDIALSAGNSRACRAVGMANNRNPIAIIVPCHRVIGSDGSLTGYAGGLELKRHLLELEGYS
ncbi:MAG: methylated-DNA--[protein]-cysteine S-methyltransferase [Treponema sp.]|jgi:methylated-DNA-[protein]-cysteine S-methyltransferase|nr:methylated-DNA--[protein]-cysteine S-methyltransferase [Treponema sp.]